MKKSSNLEARRFAFESDYISIDSHHDLQDILMRINMPQASSQFERLWVKINPFVDCDSSKFLAEVWGVSRGSSQEKPQCLYVAPKHS